MKKIIVVTLALVMALMMCASAFAVEHTQTGTQDIDVKAQYSGTITTPNKVCVDITWGKMEFTYSEAGTKDWDATKHEYTNNTSDTWTGEGNTVTVINHSNIPLTISLEFKADATYSLVTGSFGEKASFDLDSAVNTKYDEAPKDTATLTLDGQLADTVSQMTKIGSITVTIAEKTTTNP